MPCENERIVRALLEAWNRGDYTAALEPIAGDIRVECTLGGDFDGTFEGVAGLQEWLGGFWSSFADFHTEIDECIVGDDVVVIAAHHYARGRTSEIDVEMLNWQVVTLKDGEITRYRLYRTKPEALAAAGLSTG